MLWKYVHLGDVKPHVMHTQNKNSKILKKKISKILKQRHRGKKPSFLAPHYILFSSVPTDICIPVLCLCAGFNTNRKLNSK